MGKGLPMDRISGAGKGAAEANGAATGSTPGSTAAANGTAVNGAADNAVDQSANEIINSMEQGVLVWSAEGVCLMHNNRIFDVLELRADDIYLGCTRQEFLDMAVKRGEITQERMDKTEGRFKAAAPFAFDRQMPSGRVVTTNARPMEHGGFVVTFTDVTAARRNEAALADAKQQAEDAEQMAREALEGEQARQHESRQLSELDEWLQCCKSLDELFTVVSSFMAKLLPGTTGELYIYSNSRDVLDGACYWNGGGGLEHIAPDACWALRRGRPYEFGVGTIDFECDHVTEQGVDVTGSRYLCVPIVAHGDTVGLLHIRFGAGDHGNPHTDLHQFAIQCGEHISLAIANVKLRDELRDQSTRDPLTGLYNRRYFIEMLRSEIGRAARSDDELGLVTFDADNFKAFNDNHGHDAGDMVLRAIGDTVQHMFKNRETACRYGGEEFAVLVPQTSLAEATEIAETLRQAIEAVRIRYGNDELPKVTISAGVSVYPAHGRLPQDLLKAADAALYQAKADGRNCVAVAPQG